MRQHLEHQYGCSQGLRFLYLKGLQGAHNIFQYSQQLFLLYLTLKINTETKTGSI